MVQTKILLEGLECYKDIQMTAYNRYSEILV